MNLFSKLHYRQKLTLLVSVALLLPMLTTFVLLGGFLKKQLTTNFTQRLKADVSALELLQTHLRSQLEQGLAGLASDNTLQITMGLQIVPQLGNYLQRQSQALGIPGLQVFTPSGSLLAGTADLPHGCTESSATSLWSENNGVSLCARKPIRQGGQLLGYIVGGTPLDLATINHHIGSRMVDNFLLIVDKQIVLSNLGQGLPPTLSGLPEPGKRGTISIGDEEFQFLNHRSSDGSRTINTCALLPLQPLKRSLWNTGLKLAGLALVLYLILLFILQRLARGLSVPIQRLTRAAARVEKGDYRELDLDMERDDEFGLLNRTFGRMTCAQQSHAALLEEQVAARTSELQATNQALQADILARQRAEREKSQLESQLRQTQKMEALGTLAGGIAHDFNNILMPILCFSDLAKRRLSSEHEALRHLDEILKAGTRARDLVSQILSFSRQDKQLLQPANLAMTLSEVMKLVRASTPAGIDIRLELEAPETWVEANTTQLHQLILNLCTNAVQAMGHHGLLEVSQFSEGPDTTTLRIKDSGQGMDAATLEHMFEPFFTTKEIGRGTGMGLAVVHGIVNNHKGHINADSVPGQGTTFEVTFPTCPSPPIGLEQANMDLPEGTETIMVVDDEPAILHAWEAILKELGYTVKTAMTPDEALRFAEGTDFDCDLLITDQNMPGMAGAELALKIKQTHPQLPIILSTGHSESCTAEDAKLLGFSLYLHKPCNIKDLAQSVRQVLDQSNGYGGTNSTDFMRSTRKRSDLPQQTHNTVTIVAGR